MCHCSCYCYFENTLLLVTETSFRYDTVSFAVSQWENTTLNGGDVRFAVVGWDFGAQHVFVASRTGTMAAFNVSSGVTMRFESGVRDAIGLLVLADRTPQVRP